ncbi:MAG: methyltransferase domain-containing protein [Candidatus Thorarchaeota archaeon]|nr:methyltransferase domain-containing protein [Candidatus Thorarchaeota archaeon]
MRLVLEKKRGIYVRLKDLEIALQSIERDTEFDVGLEQYPTPPNIAASILFAAHIENSDIQNKVVCDLGCGDGIFALGAALLGAKRVIGVDVQSKALKVSRKNALMLGTGGTTDWVLADVTSFGIIDTVDTVVSNPPFGTKRRGADLRFLSKAISIAKVIYSLHLAGEKNRIFLEGAIEALGGVVTQIETFEFPIGKIYEFHKKEQHLIGVDLYRIVVGERETNG